MDREVRGADEEGAAEDTATAAVREGGRTVREALSSTPKTVRLVAIVAVATAAFAGGSATASSQDASPACHIDVVVGPPAVGGVRI
ncbi:hypothetical protein [Acrocarpospora catenulata]|uniref:hypothetical protein n=1 Tax=Acrocarpospora catenulata TaxID=2836182 RepID=UPI001BDA9A8D|nr:hypothetical protein [Acrocarpospora catenulata]